VLPHRVDRGILGRLNHQRKASPPAWWLKKREAYLAQRQLMRAQSAHFHEGKHAVPTHAPRPAAHKPVEAPPVAKAAQPADDFPGQATVAAAYRRASQLAGVEKKEGLQAAAKQAAAAVKEAAVRARATPAKAAALQHTADSLEQLAAGMSKASFKATPGKLAAIAKDLAAVSTSLSGTAERAAEAKLASQSK
jgi:hypothetical protein